MASRVTLELVGRVPAIPTADALLGSPVRRFADSVMLTGVNHLNVVVPVDRGGIRNMLQPNVTLTRVDQSGALPSGVQWGAPGAAAASTNEGKRRGPGKAPPVAEIERWIKRRGIAPTKTSKKGKVRRDRRGTLSMAFAIARKIAREGTTTGPNYVAGPHQDSPTKGWFDGLGTVVLADVDRRMRALADSIQVRWNALTR